MLKNMKLSLKIGGGFALILLLAAAIAIIGGLGLLGVSKSVEKADDANRIVKEILEMRQSEKNYIMRQDETYLTELINKKDELLATIIEAETSLEEAEDKSRINEIETLVNQYYTAFEDFVELYEQRVEAENNIVEAAQGLEKQSEQVRQEQKEEYSRLFNENAAPSELDDKLTKSDDANRIIKWVLNARRAEKNYQLRKDVTYTASVYELIDNIIILAEDMKNRFQNDYNKGQADTIIDSADSYKVAFDNLLDAYTQMDEAEEKMLEYARNAVALATEASDVQKEKMNSEISQSLTLMITVIIIAVVFGIILSILITLSITGALKKGVDFALRLSEGDLTTDLNVVQRDEIGKLAEALRNMKDKLKEVVVEVKNSSSMVSQGSQQLATTAEQISQGATEQAATAEEVSSSMEEIGASIKQNTDNAAQTEKIASKAANDAEDGGAAVLEAVEAMNLIAQKIKIIEELARNTNLLSLNAAIEAARAGEHGKGFAVVASEVGKLAANSQSAANEILELANTSVDKANNAGHKIQSIIPDIRKTADLVQEISATSNEQNTGAEQVNQVMIQLDQVIQQNAAAAEESSSMSEELSSQAEKLLEMIGFFIVDDTYHNNRKYNLKKLPTSSNREKSPGIKKASSQLELNSSYHAQETGSDDMDKDFIEF